MQEYVAGISITKVTDSAKSLQVVQSSCAWGSDSMTTSKSLRME